MDKSQHIELMGLTLFVLGLGGIILFFYMAFTLFTHFPSMEGTVSTNSTQITSDFIGYLIQITVPILILLVVGGVSILIAQYGISTYSRESRKTP